MTEAMPIISALTVAAIVILQLSLMMMVGFKRLEHNQGLGDGDHPDLFQAIRRHGNLAENSGLFCVSLALTEIAGGATTALMILGFGFVIVRISHAVGLSLGDTPNIPRAVGAFGTLLCMASTAIYLVYLIYSHTNS